MKIFCLTASLILSFSSISQKSYYFSDPLPSVESKVTHVDSKWFGTYKSSTGIISYKVDEAGIAIISTAISSISKESVRESTKYDVRNGYIFGVHDVDSIPCVYEDDRYYFGIRNHDVFVGEGSENVLAKTSSNTSYILNQSANGNYIPMLLEFKGGKLKISYFEYDDETSDFSFVETQKSIKTQYQELIVLSPSETEFNKLKADGVFDLPRVFKR